MALPPDKVRAYRPLLDVLVQQLLAEYEAELQEASAGETDSVAPSTPRDQGEAHQ